MSYAEAYKELVKSNYYAYVHYVHDGLWKPSKAGKFLTNEVQKFIEEETGNAFDILIVSMPPQHGKLQADDTPVLTSEGWKKHGDLKVGDYVYNHKGEKVRVTYVHPKYFANREISFTNGEKIKCHENHEWVVLDRSTCKEKTVETKFMEGNLGNSVIGRGHRYRFLLPLREPIKGERKPLAVPPYVLGVWLGDGKNNGGQICSCKEDIVTLDECRKYYPDGREWVHKDTGVIYRSFRGLYKGLQEYGMCHATRRTEKHIPEEYLTASLEDRLELLAGLLDTDGYLYAKANRYTFTTADKELKETFIDLIHTFGWRTSVYETKPITSTSGIEGKSEYWQICFNPTCEIPCRIERKRIHSFSKQRRIAVSGIREIEPVSGNCITVEGGIYLVGRSMIPTHNSMSITETLPSWYLGRNPTHRVIEVSYSEDFAKLFGRRNKQKIETVGQELFGIELAQYPNSAIEFELSNNVGGMISRGILSGVTGRPANLIIIDDPVKNAQEANSASYRNSVWQEWLMSIRTRLAAGAKVIVIMTRWHEDDLAGRMIAEEKNVRVINLPCECESEDDLLGRDLGEALMPEIGKDDTWLIDFKQGYMTKNGSMAWNAMFQGRPAAMEGNLIKREWWQYYDVLPECPIWIMSVDATFKDKEDNDFVAIQCWAKRETDMYLVDQIRKHLDFTETINAIKSMKGKYPNVRGVYIEDKANGSAIISVLRKTMLGVIAVNPEGGKVSRANAVTPYIEAGNIYLPRFSAFSEDLIDECAAFPNGAHDDLVDCMSQAINKLANYKAKGKKQTETMGTFHNVLSKQKSKIGRGEKIRVI